MGKVDDMRAMSMLQLNAGDSVVPPTTVTGSTTTGLLGCSVNSLASKHQFGDLVNPLSESSSISNNTGQLPVVFISVMEVPAASRIVTLSYSSRFTEEVSAASPTLTDGWGDAQDNGFAHDNDDNDEKDGCGGERSLDSTTKSFLDAHKTVTRSLLANGFGDEDDPWAAIAAPPPSTTVRALNSSSPAVPKATGSSALRVQWAEHVTNDGASHGRVQG
ncbi:unnamed protein product [Sphagnum balticum]